MNKDVWFHEYQINLSLREVGHFFYFRDCPEHFLLSDYQGKIFVIE